MTTYFACTHARTGAIATLTATAALLLTTACGAGDRARERTDDAPADQAAAGGLPAARILAPPRGEELSGPVRVALAAENIEIAPAGDTRPNSGHYHLFLNTEPVAEGEAIPAGVAGIVHLGQAQSEHTFADLPPGEYTLIVAIGDLAHRMIAQTPDTVRFRVVEPSS